MDETLAALQYGTLHIVGSLIMALLWAKKRVSRGALGAHRCGPNENLREWLSSCRTYLASVVVFVLMFSTKCKMKSQIVVIEN